MSVRDFLPIYLCHVGRYLDAFNFVANWIIPTPGTIPARGGTNLDSHAKSDYDPTLALNEDLTLKLKKGIESTINAELIYTGAKAAYELWGDCELATLFWRTGARLNFHVARHLLAGIEQPSEFFW